MAGTLGREVISTRQRKIAELAQREPKLTLTTLAHHVDEVWMREAYRRIRKDAAAGVDGVTAAQYEADLEANLSGLLERFKSGRYRAPAVRRVHLEKPGTSKTRPIGIPTLEDKILQRAVLMVLEPVYEQDFLECSYGFRPGRGAHQALQSLWEGLMEFGGGWVIDLDIEDFFGSVDWGHLRSFLDQRVQDGVIRRAIGKWLNAGVMEAGELSYPQRGTPQGGVISPTLSNVYLHEVLDEWFEHEVKPRLRGRAFEVTVGRHGVITAEEARRRAALIVARIKAGEDPVPEPMAAKLLEGPTVGELARDWLDEHVAVRCKAKTAYIYRLVVEKHILPGFGKKPALGVSHVQVTELHHGLRERPVTANRAVDVLSRIYNAAEDRGRIPEASNPCRRVAKFRERARERFLTDGEFRRLGRVLDEAETRKGVSVHAVAAIRLLLLTGCRKGEILNLRWDEVDLGANELRLPDTKTGPRTISLSPEAAGVLAAIPRVAGNPHVIPGKVEGRPMRNLNDPWDLICERAGLEDARIHDCRHSYASRALALGESLPMIGRLLGHTQVETTARYAHLAKASVRDSAVRISESIAADLVRDYPGAAAAA